MFLVGCTYSRPESHVRSTASQFMLDYAAEAGSPDFSVAQKNKGLLLTQAACPCPLWVSTADGAGAIWGVPGDHGKGEGPRYVVCWLVEAPRHMTQIPSAHAGLAGASAVASSTYREPGGEPDAPGRTLTRPQRACAGE